MFDILMHASFQFQVDGYVTGSFPPGDLFALGSKQTKHGDSSLQKPGGSSATEKKLSTFGDRKRDASSLLAPGGAPKKPKLIASGQTFTPLGRPLERDTDRRLSPVPPISYAFEENAIDGLYFARYLHFINFKYLMFKVLIRSLVR